MKLGMMSTAAAIVALSAGMAAADCSDKVAEFGQEYSDIRTTERGADRTNVLVLRDLRSAASRLAAAGNEDGCEAVVQAMHEVGDAARDSMNQAAATNSETTERAAADEKPADAANTDDTANADKTDDTANADAAKTDETAKAAEGENIETADVSPTMEARNARLVAVVDSNMLIDTGSLKGYNVYNYNDEFLGEIDGLLIKPGAAPSHFIIGHGGFLSIGDKEAAVPIEKMMWDPEEEVFYLNMTEEQLDKAPDYDLVDGTWVVDQNDSYYESVEVQVPTKTE